jgi:hypothetical protein
MVADLSVYFDFGGTDATPGTQQDTDGLGPPNMRFKQADDATINTSNPIPIPAAGSSFSRWKQIYLKCDTAPGTQIDNIKFYSDGGGFGTGITLNVGNQFPTKNSGTNSGYQVADVSATMIGGHTGISTQTDVFTLTSGAPLSGPTISESGNIINAQNETTNYLVLQMVVVNTASPGDLANETLTFQYDEI